MTYDLSFATYATLAEVRAELEVNNPLVVSEDPKAIRALIDATARIELELAGKTFLPRVQTRYFNAVADTEGLNLRLNEPLAELTSVTNGDGAVLTSGQYTLIPRSGPPYHTIRLEANGAVAWQTAADGDPVDAITVAGVWHSTRPVSGGWYAPGETLTLASTSTASFTPADVDEKDAYRRTPRFSEGMLLKATSSGTTEYLEITRIESGVVYVRRGARGSTAVAHTAAALSAWQVDPVIGKACVRLASYYYKRMGHFASVSFNLATGMNERLPEDLPPDVIAVLEKFKGVNAPTFRILGV